MSGSGALIQRIAIRLYIFVEVEVGSRCHTNVGFPIVARTVPRTEKTGLVFGCFDLFYNKSLLSSICSKFHRPSYFFEMSK